MCKPDVSYIPNCYFYPVYCLEVDWSVSSMPVFAVACVLA